MTSLTFNSNIWGGKALLLQYSVVYGGGESGYVPKLEVLFPDNSLLTINVLAFAAKFGTLDDWNTAADPEYWSNMKLDLSKWNWLTIPESTASILLLPLEDLKDANRYPGGSLTEYFTYEDADGIPIEFPDVPSFPVGIYKVTMKGTVTGTTDRNDSRRVMCLSEIEDHIARYINMYTDLRSDENATRSEIETLRDMVMKLMMIEYTARYDFSRNKYEDSNEKIQSLKLICESGEYSYKSGH